jgi:hypothetical protein
MPSAVPPAAAATAAMRLHGLPGSAGAAALPAAVVQLPVTAAPSSSHRAADVVQHQQLRLLTLCWS